MCPRRGGRSISVFLTRVFRAIGARCSIADFGRNPRASVTERPLALPPAQGTAQMPEHQQATKTEKVEKRALECELTAQLALDARIRQRNENKARRIREVLDRLNRRKQRK